MDDSLDSVRDNDSAIQLVQELQELWAKAGMKARKWLSNSSEVLAAIPKELRAYEIDLNDSLPATKTLGVLWREQQDVLTFQVKKPTEEDKLTKRIILSKVAGVFDPLHGSRESVYDKRKDPLARHVDKGSKLGRAHSS